MQQIDYAVLIGFLVWMVAIGAICSRRMKSASEMFAAGGRCPWWVSGLSGFMTIFSAGTFVVWGGIAYRLGLVAVSILMIVGLAMILIGATVAPRWRRMGIATPTEFLRIRFTEAVVQVYTWLGMLYQGVALTVGLYCLSVMLAVLTPLPEGAPFRDAATGNLSVSWGIVLWGAIVISYTMAGGLWAVLMTDVIQCLVLCLSVLVAVPLSLSAVGGIDALWTRAPEGFFSLAAGEYGFTFLFLWFWLALFRYAADWAFVQRYICVPTPRDARKVAYLMGALYLVCPMIWMLPALAYRVLDGDAKPEEAYMLMCHRVLPAGALGMMVAAMFSSTASTVSSVLNVFAAVFTCDVYNALINRNASPRRMVIVGRLATLLYGLAVVIGALAVPYLGGAEKLVIVLITVAPGPLMLPAVWGLYSRHIGQGAVWSTILVSTPLAVAVKCTPFVFSSGHRVALPGWFAALLERIEANARATDAILGLLVPLSILVIAETVSRRGGVDKGWTRMQAAFAAYEDRPLAAVISRLPAGIVGSSLAMLGLSMCGITVLADRQQTTLAFLSALLLLAAAVTLWRGFRTPRAE